MNVRIALAAVLALALGAGLQGQQLQIHYINVGWGSSVLVIGPDGTTVLMEAGDTGMGTNRVVPYLQSIGIPPTDGLDYTIVGHQHCDHNGGMDEVIAIAAARKAERDPLLRSVLALIINDGNRHGLDPPGLRLLLLGDGPGPYPTEEKKR